MKRFSCRLVLAYSDFGKQQFPPNYTKGAPYIIDYVIIYKYCQELYLIYRITNLNYILSE